MTGNRFSVPDLVDNRKITSVTLADVLLRILLESTKPRLWVATAYFNLDALRELEPALNRLCEMRLLIGREQEQTFVLADRLYREIELSLAQGNPSISFMELKKWSSFLEKEHVQIRLYEGGFLHGKAYLITGVPLVSRLGIVGSSNFTGAGLNFNLELNAVLKQESAVSELQRWFEALWEKARDYKADLLELLTKFTQTYSPYDIYMKVLYEAYSDRFEADLAAQDRKPSPVALVDFQRDGYLAAKEILENYGGVLIADSVGLGKSFLTLRLLDDYAYRERQTALIICPAALIDTLWRPLLERFSIPHKIVSMELVSQRDFPVEEYALYKVIVVDESHNLRNPNSNRWGNLFRVLTQGDPDKKLILLTATPVNNTVFDLYQQIRLITRDQRDFFVAAGIKDLHEYFRRAEQNKDSLYEVLEAIAVRRSRQFIRTNYPNAVIDGKPVRFPERRLHTVRYSLEASYGKALYDKTAQAIENLLLAPYQVDTFRKEVLQAQRQQIKRLSFSEDEEATPLKEHLVSLGWPEKEAQEFIMSVGRQTALAHIMRVLYLKRLESSVEALRISLKRQLNFQKAFLSALNNSRLLDSKAYRWLQTEATDDQAEDEPDLSGILEQLPPLPADQYDLEALRQAVNADIQTLEELLAELEQMTIEHDDKLQTLKVLLTDELKGKKVVLFSYFKDTARYLYRQLTSDEDLLQKLGHRQVSIVDSDVKPEERKDRILRFAPQASNREDIPPGWQIQLLISTDVLSEGQNLQDADTIINYDLHWNPVRMVQRIGRLDRIGSPHDTIHVYNFSPEDALENLLGLLERLYKKLDAINRTVGLDASVLGEVPNPMDFNTLLRIAQNDEAVLDELEADSELVVGEFLAQDLLQFLKDLGEERLKRIPLSVGTAKDGHGQHKGFFAAFRNVGMKQHHWLFFDEISGKVVESRLEAIRTIRCGPDEVGRALPEGFDPRPYVEKLRQHLLTRLRQAVHSMPELPSPQNQIVNWMQTLPPSGERNELLAYFAQPLSGPILRELRRLWKERTRLDEHEWKQSLLGFARSHPHPERGVTSPREEVTEQDLECIAWVWVG